MTLPVADGDPVDIEEAWRTEVMLRLARLEDMLRVVATEVQRIQGKPIQDTDQTSMRG